MFIDAGYIEDTLEKAGAVTDSQIDAILNKAEAFRGLSHGEVAALLMDENASHLERVYRIAGEIKRHIYGNRIVMFAPLYVSDYCVNRCAYCSYNCSNRFERRRLTMDQVRREVEILEGMGHKRIALEAGEDDARCPIGYILECIKTIYGMKLGNGEIRRINVNIAATTTESYARLKEAGIGTYILFQETYHRPTYEKVHPSGPKRDFEYHLTAFDRAMEGGVDDVGGGVLFGLADPRFEVMGLMLHNEHLEKKFGVGFHTISVPRLCKADGMDMADFPHLLDDGTFKKIVAVIRLAVPFTGMILSTRENDGMRRQLLSVGISQLSAGSSTQVGGYSLREEDSGGGAPQFRIRDERSAVSVISGLMDEGYIPSFCTACYRGGRTGDRFMRLAKSGQIKNVCLPNALMTLQEYAMDYGDAAFRHKAAKIIEEFLPDIGNRKIRTLTTGNVDKIRQGQRDLYI